MEHRSGKTSQLEDEGDAAELKLLIIHRVIQLLETGNGFRSMGVLDAELSAAEFAIRELRNLADRHGLVVSDEITAEQIAMEVRSRVGRVAGSARSTRLR